MNIYVYEIVKDVVRYTYLLHVYWVHDGHVLKT